MEPDVRLTDRKEVILQTVVEEYMATARPVGSSLVAEQSDLKVSSATVRKDLHALEDEGFLHQPHTSCTARTVATSGLGATTTDA